MHIQLFRYNIISKFVFLVFYCASYQTLYFKDQKIYLELIIVEARKINSILLYIHSSFMLQSFVHFKLGLKSSYLNKVHMSMFCIFSSHIYIDICLILSSTITYLGEFCLPVLYIFYFSVRFICRIK